MPSPATILRLKLGLYAALSLAAAVSLYGGLRNAFSSDHGQDLQWSGAQLAVHHIDPYRQYLSGDPEHRILLVQIPNYLHELYILLLPLGALSFATAQRLWAVANCVFTVVFLVLLRRIYGLSNDRTALLTLLLLASTPFRIALAAGQHTFLELVFFCMAFYWPGPAKRGFALGLSYFKYSFSPVLVLYLALRREYRILLASLVPPLVGLLLMAALVHTDPFRLAIEPFQVSRTGVWPGLGDLMTVLQSALKPHLDQPALGKVMYAAALVASVATALLLARRRNVSPRTLLAATGIAGLAFFLHLAYDYVFLVLPLAWCLAATQPCKGARIAILAAIAWLWYGIRLLPRHAFYRTVEITTLLLLLVILFVLVRNEDEPAGLSS